MKKIEWNDALNCLNIMRPMESLDRQMRDGRIVGNYLMDDKLSVEDEVERKLDRELLKKTLSKSLTLLSTLEKQVIILYFGLYGIKSMSASKIARMKGCTPQNIQQAIRNGIKKLRDNETLKEYYEILN